MKNRLTLFLGLLVYAATLFVVMFALAFWWASNKLHAPGNLSEITYFEVARGDGLMEIAHNLREANAVDNPYIFVFGARVLNAQGDLKAGEYELTPGISARAILDKIRKGEVFARRITIREGLTSYETDSLVTNIKDIKIIKMEPSSEGSLLPGTYDYKTTDTNANLIHRMNKAMQDVVAAAWAKRPPDSPLQTPEQIVTLASIIEKETGKAEERRAVAGVFINRLKQGMPLQSDPTVIYALTGGKPKNDGQGPLGRRLLSKDLEIDSPYNTYKYPGLPPGAICNPGKESIEAAVNPESHDYIYFVADGTGGHVFARTLNAHNAHVAKWREIRKSMNQAGAP